MDLVDEEDSPFLTLDLLEQHLETLLKVTAVLGPCQQGTHVQGVDGTVCYHLGHVTLDDTIGEPLGDGGLAHTGLPHQQGIVLAATAEHLNGAAQLLIATDQRIDSPLQYQLVEVGGKALDLGGGDLVIGLGIVAATLGLAVFAHPVGEEVHHIQPAYLGFFQEVSGLGLLLAEDGDQYIGTAHLGIARRLDMEHGTLQHALEAKGRLGFSVFVIAGDERGRLIDECANFLAHLLHIRTTRTQRLMG
ncbi:hypothetical protein D3C75_565180 [compost metagenome]